MTKTAIACAAFRLAGRGTVDLDAPVRGRPLRALLRHEGRLPCYTALPAYRAAVSRDDAAWTAEEVIARCAQLPAPSGWAYSNLGYLHARQALEAATGLPLGEVLRREVLDPAGLTRTTLAEGRAVPGLRYDFGWVHHGCLLGPAHEAAAMMAAILGDLLPPAAREELARATPLGGELSGRPWTAHGYGTGLMVGTAGGARTEGHSGSGPGSTCAVYRTGVTVAAAFAGTDRPGVTERAVVRAATGRDRG